MWDNIGGNGKGGKLAVNVIVVVGIEEFVARVGVGCVDIKVKVILSVIGEVAGAPLDNDAASLDEWLSLLVFRGRCECQ